MLLKSRAKRRKDGAKSNLGYGQLSSCEEVCADGFRKKFKGMSKSRVLRNIRKGRRDYVRWAKSQERCGGNP